MILPHITLAERRIASVHRQGTLTCAESKTAGPTQKPIESRIVTWKGDLWMTMTMCSSSTLTQKKHLSLIFFILYGRSFACLPQDDVNYLICHGCFDLQSPIVIPKIAKHPQLQWNRPCSTSSIFWQWHLEIEQMYYPNNEHFLQDSVACTFWSELLVHPLVCQQQNTAKQDHLTKPCAAFSRDSVLGAQCTAPKSNTHDVARDKIVVPEWT